MYIIPEKGIIYWPFFCNPHISFLLVGVRTVSWFYISLCLTMLWLIFKQHRVYWVIMLDGEIYGILLYMVSQIVFL